jgi:1-deoxy-D-xylulose-5-phosphate reductoisomerase
MSRGLVILGATGSIGDTTFKILDGLDGFELMGLSAGRQVDKLIERIEVFRPQVVCVQDEESAAQVRRQAPQVQVLHGARGLRELVCLDGVDYVVNGLVGAVGLMPTLAALQAGRIVCMANKEPLIMAGDALLAAARRGGGEIRPVDSEPSAMWQCLQGGSSSIRRLILTASGGAFRDYDREQLARVTPAQALNHPTWQMGAKITVDSASLMNKGFEVIEASILFGVDVDQVEVVIHRESIVHSMVEFTDGSILAHMGKTDMALPIQYALTHPDRMETPLAPLDLTSVGALHFAEPDWDAFPGLQLCYEAGRRGGQRGRRSGVSGWDHRLSRHSRDQQRDHGIVWESAM